MQFPVEQGAVRIDVEIGRLRQRAGLLPPEKAAPGRDESQLPIELPQPGFGQTLDDCLTIIALGAFGHDQQVAGRPELVCEWLESDQLHRIRPDAVPCGDLVTEDIRWCYPDCRASDCRVRVQLVHSGLQ